MTLSLLDRFEQVTPDALGEQIARDIEDLLSARRTLDDPARHGVLAYGMPALDDIVRRSRQDKNKVAKRIEATLRAFEPRFSRVRVNPIEHERDFHFTITADMDDHAGTVTLQVISPLFGAGLGAEARTMHIDTDESGSVRSTSDQRR